MGLHLELVRQAYAGDYRVRRFWLLGSTAAFVHTVLDPILTYAVVTLSSGGFLPGLKGRGVAASSRCRLQPTPFRKLP